MKTVNTFYSTDEQLAEFIIQNAIHDSEQLLIQLFTATNDNAFLLKLTDFIRQRFPLAVLIGATTDGEIKDGEVSTGETVVSFTLFADTRLRSYISDSFENYYAAGQAMASALVENDTKALIAFIDGLSGNGEAFLDGIHSVAPTLLVAGGLAGDNATFSKTYIFDKDKVVTNGVVGVALSSKDLHVFTDSSFNWKPVGKKLCITKAKENRVYTIDGKTAVDTYNYYLGNDIGNHLPYVGIEFPLLIRKRGMNIARAPIAKMEDGSLIFAGNLKTGDMVNFGYGDSEIILNEVKMHIDKLCCEPVESIFIYSCMARRRFIPDSIEHETRLYNEIAPVSGFYTYGEFYCSSNSKYLLNQSMTIIALSESGEIHNKKVDFDITAGKSTAIQALAHLVSVSTQELDEAREKLKILAATDALTGLYNRRHFFNIARKIYHHSLRGSRPLCVIMLDIDHFKQINDKYGHNVGDEVILELAAILQSPGRRQSDIVCRYGGEEFVMLLPDTVLQDTARIAESLRKEVEDRTLTIDNNQQVKFTISIGVSQVDLASKETLESSIDRADQALYASKNGGRNLVTVV